VVGTLGSACVRRVRVREPGSVDVSVSVGGWTGGGQAGQVHKQAVAAAGSTGSSQAVLFLPVRAR
jgi:hypothetical protein